MSDPIERKQEIVFVLVRPSFLGNIGSVARVLKNFDFHALRLVAPPKAYKDAEARKMSLGAFDILKNARVFETLSEALADVNTIIGTTCTHQREIDFRSVHELDQIVKVDSENRVAIIFGEERDGLLKDELAKCHQIITIPTNPDFPSLNLAQAVGIFAYELSRSKEHSTRRSASGTGSNPEPISSSTSPAADSRNEDRYSTGAEDDELFNELDKLLHRVEFSRQYNKQIIFQKLRSLYLRARPTSRESGMLRGIISKIDSKLNERADSSD